MGVQERKQREKANRQQAILAAAKHVFQTKGLLAATIDHIAAEAEMGKGTLYRYYRSKEDIMLAINEEAFQELYRCYVAAVAEGGSGLEKMMRTLRAYYRFALDNPAYFGFIAFFESPFASITPERLYDISTAIHQLIRGLHAEGLADGSIRQDVTADMTANTFWATSYGMMQFIISKGSYLFQQQDSNTADLFETYLSILEKGMRT